MNCCFNRSNFNFHGLTLPSILWEVLHRWNRGLAIPYKLRSISRKNENAFRISTDFMLSKVGLSTTIVIYLLIAGLNHSGGSAKISGYHRRQCSCMNHIFLASNIGSLIFQTRHFHKTLPVSLSILPFLQPPSAQRIWTMQPEICFFKTLGGLPRPHAFISAHWARANSVKSHPNLRQNHCNNQKMSHKRVF